MKQLLILFITIFTFIQGYANNPPCTDCTHYTGEINGTVNHKYQPNGTYYYSDVAGKHEAWLKGHSSDLDLYLWNWTGEQWQLSARSDSFTSEEHVLYEGRAGYYIWMIVAYSGQSSYDFWLTTPKAAETWIPFIPSPDQTTLQYNPDTKRVTVSIVFPNSGFRVDWGELNREGNRIIAKARVEKWTGHSMQVITTRSNEYSLGNLSAGNYTFHLQSFDKEIKSLSFAVGETKRPVTFVATLRGNQEVPPVNTQSTGVASLVLSPDEKSAKLSLSFSNLSSTETAAHVHGPADPGESAGAVFSIPLGQVNDLEWTFVQTGPLTVADQIRALKAGRLYVNVHSARYPNGEIRGHFYPVQSPSPTPTPVNIDIESTNDTIRFLEQATFGPSPSELQYVKRIGFRAYLNEQFSLPASNYNGLPIFVENGKEIGDLYRFKLRFFQNALQAKDQLRQRMVHALSQIFVVSFSDPDFNKQIEPAILSYLDVLNRNAFGNFKQLLHEITLNPSMGAYLDMVDNRKADPSKNSQPNENYARELLQLFSIGIFNLNLDGTIQLDSSYKPVESYSNEEVKAFARALTGWVYAQNPSPDPSIGRRNNYFGAPLIAKEARHDKGSKQLLGGKVLPAGQSATKDLSDVIENVFNHPNVGPFISRLLIQHLVTSNPSPQYIQRTASVFNNNGMGIRGDMRAVISAILLDPEARGDRSTGSGKLREPALLITNLLRRFNAQGDLYGVPEWSDRMEQDIFNPPTVFNFFQPDYRINYAGQSYFSPETQILTTETAIHRINFIRELLYSAIKPGRYGRLITGSSTATVDLTNLLDMAADPPKLVSSLNETLLHGTMPESLKNIVLETIAQIPQAQRAERVRTAIYLMAASTNFQVQR
jgi:uncharacterized protein (DUF1800 family)